jgi:hypothetical protein
LDLAWDSDDVECMHSLGLNTSALFAVQTGQSVCDDFLEIAASLRYEQKDIEASVSHLQHLGYHISHAKAKAGDRLCDELEAALCSILDPDIVRAFFGCLRQPTAFNDIVITKLLQSVLDHGFYGELVELTVAAIRLPNVMLDALRRIERRLTTTTSSMQWLHTHGQVPFRVYFVGSWSTIWAATRSFSSHLPSNTAPALPAILSASFTNDTRNWYNCTCILVDPEAHADIQQAYFVGAEASAVFVVFETDITAHSGSSSEFSFSGLTDYVKQVTGYRGRPLIIRASAASNVNSITASAAGYRVMRPAVVIDDQQDFLSRADVTALLYTARKMCLDFVNTRLDAVGESRQDLQNRRDLVCDGVKSLASALSFPRTLQSAENSIILDAAVSTGLVWFPMQCNDSNTYAGLHVHLFDARHAERLVVEAYINAYTAGQHVVDRHHQPLRQISVLDSMTHRSTDLSTGMLTGPQAITIGRKLPLLKHYPLDADRRILHQLNVVFACESFSLRQLTRVQHGKIEAAAVFAFEFTRPDITISLADVTSVHITQSNILEYGIDACAMTSDLMGTGFVAWRRNAVCLIISFVPTTVPSTAHVQVVLWQIMRALKSHGSHENGIQTLESHSTFLHSSTL